MNPSYDSLRELVFWMPAIEQGKVNPTSATFNWIKVSNGNEIGVPVLVNSCLPQDKARITSFDNREDTVAKYYDLDYSNSLRSSPKLCLYSAISYKERPNRVFPSRLSYWLPEGDINRHHDETSRSHQADLVLQRLTCSIEDG